jgi:drug/metabolite transporter (DMT)-like permease
VGVTPLLALASAGVFGAADFLGGMASRRWSALPVAAVGQLVGLVAVLATALVLPADPTPADLAVGALSGLAGGAGLVLLYRGLAIGPMNVVAPVTAALAALVPAAVGIGVGERPGPGAVAGIVLAIAAIVLVSMKRSVARTGRPEAASRLRTGLASALLAGIGFGGFFTLLERTGAGSGLWPLVGARLAAVPMFAALLLARRPARPDRPALTVAVLAGILDMTANVLYVLAVRGGLLSLVAVLASLYPVSTVVLARLVLGERLGRLQFAGLVLAAAGVALLAAG